MRMLPPGLMPQNSGIASLLNPIIRVVSEDYKQDVVDPYIQQVEQLTTTTFPDVQFGNMGTSMPPSFGNVSPFYNSPISGGIGSTIGVGGLLPTNQTDAARFANDDYKQEYEGILDVYNAALGPLVR